MGQKKERKTDGMEDTKEKAWERGNKNQKKNAGKKERKKIMTRKKVGKKQRKRLKERKKEMKIKNEKD